MSKDKNGLPNFTGPFCELIPEYISYKRAQGYMLQEAYVYRLRAMDLFFKTKGIKDISITRELYEEYTSLKEGENPSTTEQRRGIIRGFAKYLIFRGYKDIYAGCDDSRVFKTDFIPYIFTKDQIQDMFRILAEQCRVDPGYENDTFRLVMLLYYCCGFRKSEVQNFRLRDVDFETGKITVLHGKNDVSRIVVVSNSLLVEIRGYRDKYLKEVSSDSYFIRSVKGGQYNKGVLYPRFHQLLVNANIPSRQDGKSQRLHDIRHTFCVRTLEAIVEKGFDLYTTFPLLSIYLGHKHLTETEYYLRMIDEHFGGILNKITAYTQELFPKYLETEGGGEDEE